MWLWLPAWLSVSAIVDGDIILPLMARLFTAASLVTGVPRFSFAWTRRGLLGTAGQPDSYAIGGPLQTAIAIRIESVGPSFQVSVWSAIH